MILSIWIFSIISAFILCALCASVVLFRKPPGFSYQFAIILELKYSITYLLQLGAKLIDIIPDLPMI